MTIHPVILCGGAGVRLWPASRPSRPKQFLPLVGPNSSFQNTLIRLAGLAEACAGETVAEPVIVTGAAHVEAIGAELRAIGARATVLVEPAGRDSAPAIAAAMSWIAKRDPEALAVVLAADHHIADHAAFAAAVSAALAGARAGRIVTLGVAPRGPSTAYGYIAPGEPLGIAGLHAVSRFVEKPGAEGARELIAAGCLWNSGNFVAAAKALVEELGEGAPQALAAAQGAVAGARIEGPVVRLGGEFLAAPSISIDYAVMEKTGRAAVLPVHFAWTDLGAWDAVFDASARDDRGNVSQGEAILDGASGCLVRAAPGQVVIAVNVADLAIIAEDDAVLVCHLSASQRVKGAVERLEPRPVRGLRPGADDRVSLADLARWWRRWLFTAALPLWWTLGADHERGGFYEALSADGEPLDLPRRSRVQTRQAYVFARACAMGWKGPGRAAAAHALDFFAGRFARPDGLHRFSIDARFEPLDERAFLYEEAFALLALAAQGPPREVEALALLDAVERTFRHPGGGFGETIAPRALANPLMHLFEATLAWSEAGASPRWRAVADEIATFARKRLLEPRQGFIAETYDDAWRLCGDPAAIEVSPGHQFEWAWLMLKWRALGGEGEALELARALVAAGERGAAPWGGLADAMDGRLAIIHAGGRLWPQCERLRAYLGLGEAEEGPAREAALEGARAAALVLRRYVAGSERGLFIDRIDPAGAAIGGPSLASSLYHLIGAVAALNPPGRAGRAGVARREAPDRRLRA